ncbi:hypothetical protein LSPH24S_01903 [Lysinibacillus sphaericus]
MLKSCAYCGGIHKHGQRCPSKPIATKKTTHIDRFRWSRAWKNKRAYIADRDKHLCQVCLRNLHNTQTQYNFTDLEVHDHIKSGKCFSCGDMTVDYGFIEQKVLEVEEQFNVIVMGVAYDRYNCLSTAQKLEKEGLVTVEVKQHSSVLHPATKLLREKIMNKEFHYTENELLEENFQNAKVTEDTNKNIYVNKKKSTGKVDMVVSLINAIYLLQHDVIFNPDADWGAQII